MVRLVATTLALAALVAAALVVGRPDRPAPVQARGRTVPIVLRDFRFVPQVVRVPKGRLTFELRNTGRVSHAFRVRKGGRLWIEEPTLLPGERRTVTARLPRGDYRTFDPLQNFEELGMYGTLVVR